MTNRMPVIALALLLSVAAARGGDAEAAAILSKLGHSIDGLKDYTVSIEAEISMERLRVPKMTAKLSFKQPDKIHFDADGFAMLPRQGIGLNPAELGKKYTGVVTGSDTVGGVTTARLSLIPKSDSAGMRGLAIWVDTTRWIILKAESTPYPGRVMILRIEYARVENRWWLPSKMSVDLDGAQPGGQDQPQTEQRAMPRKGTITVVYSGYSVNQNLPDALFTQSADAKPEGQERH